MSIVKQCVCISGLVIASLSAQADARSVPNAYYRDGSIDRVDVAAIDNILLRDSVIDYQRLYGNPRQIQQQVRPPVQPQPVITPAQPYAYQHPSEIDLGW